MKKRPLVVLEPLARDRRGGVAAMAAAAGLVFCVLAALAVDVGVMMLHARKVQGAADLAALAAARDLAAADRAASATVYANLPATALIMVETGGYAPDPDRAANERFTPGSGSDPNAARVRVASPVRLWFGRHILGRDTVEITRTATAALEPAGPPLATFSIGSRLVRVNGGAANAVLGALAGSSLSLSVMDYEALIDADVSLLDYLDALAVEAGVTAADYDALLQSEVEAGEALGVLRALLDGRSKSALGDIIRAADPMTLRVGDLIGVNGGLGRNIEASVSALDLTRAVLEVAGGERQVKLDLAANALLADLDVRLAVGERPNRSPWLTVTGEGEPVIRTAQTRLYVRARTRDSLAGLARVDLPIVIELAASEARLRSLSCRPQRQVTLDVRPGLARAWIGAQDTARLNDFRTPLAPQRATLLNVAGLVRVTAFADVEAADQGWRQTTFSGADIDARTIRTVATTGAVNGVVTSLLGRLDVDVRALGLGLGLGGLTAGTTSTFLAPLGPVLDDTLNPVLGFLGVRPGEADVRILGLSCPRDGGARPVLVG